MRSDDETKRKKYDHYGEVIAYSDDSRRFRESPLAIFQALVLIFFFVTMIIFAIESQYVHFINVYIFAITYAVVGVVLVFIIQIVVWALYMRGNRLPTGKTGSVAPENPLYMGWPHTKELTMAMIISILAWIFISWQLGEWLSRFGKTSSNSDPNPANNPEYTLYFGAVQISFLLSFVAHVPLISAFIAHIKPGRSVTQLFTDTKAPKK